MKVNTFTKLATCAGAVALLAAGLVSTPAQADPAGPSATALVGVGSDTTMDVMDEIAASIGGDKLASYKSTIADGQTDQLQTRPGGPTDVIRAKGSGDGWKVLQVAEGSLASKSGISSFANTGGLTATKANSVGQVDYARASSMQGTASATGEFVDIPFAIDSVGLAVNPTDAVAKIPVTGLGATTDAATKATVDAIFRCQARYVYLNNVNITGVTAASGTLTKTAHGLVVGDTIKFTGGTAPTGTTANTKYYVKTAPTANTFTISATKGGAQVNATAGTGYTVVKTSGSYAGVGADEAGAPADTTAYQITPLIPAWGSGTASYFVGKIGQTEGAGFPAAGDSSQNCIKRTFADGTTPIQEHSGASVAETENSIGIYSIGQWTSQTNSATTGATNKTSGTKLLDFYPAVSGAPTVASGLFTLTAHGFVAGDKVRFASTGTLPTNISANTDYFVIATGLTTNAFKVATTASGTAIAATGGTGTLSMTKSLPATKGTGVTLAPNEGWTSDLKRYVYNIVPYRKAIDPNSAVHEMFVGTDSLVCQQKEAIAKMGFTVLGASDGGNPTSNANSCGSINSGNRRTAASDGTSVTGASATTSATSGTIGDSFTVSVNGGSSIHNMGGTVQVLDKEYGATGANVLGSATIPAGADQAADVTVTPIAAGSNKLYAYFVPALGGIKVTNLSAVDAATDKSFATVAISAGASTTKLSVRKPSAVGGTTRVIVSVVAAVAPGGTLTLKDADSGATLGAPATLSAGESADLISFTQTKSVQRLKATFVPADATVTGSDSNSVTVTLPKLTTTLTAALTAATTAAPNGFTAGTTPAWAKVSKTQAGTPVTALNATTDLFSVATHGLVAGDRVTFTATTLPGGITAGTTYYVISSGLTTGAFKVSTTKDGSAVDVTSAGAAVKVVRPTATPRVTLTAAGPSGTTLKPSGAVKVFIGSSAADRSHEITSSSTGTTFAATGIANAVLSKARTWTWVPDVATTGKTMYLIVDYPGDDAFAKVSVTKQITVLP